MQAPGPGCRSARYHRLNQDSWDLRITRITNPTSPHRHHQSRQSINPTHPGSDIDNYQDCKTHQSTSAAANPGNPLSPRIPVQTTQISPHRHLPNSAFSRSITAQISGQFDGPSHNIHYSPPPLHGKPIHTRNLLSHHNLPPHHPPVTNVGWGLVPRRPPAALSPPVRRQTISNGLRPRVPLGAGVGLPRKPTHRQPVNLL